VERPIQCLLPLPELDSAIAWWCPHSRRPPNRWEGRFESVQDHFEKMEWQQIRPDVRQKDLSRTVRGRFD